MLTTKPLCVNTLPAQASAQLVNEDAITSIAQGLAPFICIEQRFPKWLTARAIVQQFIPERTEFVVPHQRPAHLAELLGAMDPNTLAVDSDWLTGLLFVTPPEDHAEMWDLLELVASTYTDHLAALCLQERIEPLLGRWADKVTVSILNSILEEKLQVCKALRLPLPLDIAHHQLGLSRCLW